MPAITSPSREPDGRLATGSASSASPLRPLELPDAETTMLRRWLQVVEAMPDAPCVESDGIRLTFAEVHERSTVVAHHLARLRHDGAAPLGAMMRHDTAAVVVAVAALRLGIPLVMLDAHLPAERLRVIVDLVGMTAMIVAAEYREAAAPLMSDGMTVRSYPDVSVPTPDASEVAPVLADPPSAPGPDASATDAFTIVFTSGSTGIPKGVPTPQSTVLSDVMTFRDRLGIGPSDRVLLPLPLVYSAGVCALWMCLLNGAGVVLLDPRDTGVAAVSRCIEEHDLTVLLATPYLLRAVSAEMPPDLVLASLRMAATVGEAVFSQDFENMRPHLDGAAVLVNWAGSSETGTIALNVIGAMDTIAEGAIPAGRVVDLKTVTLVDEDGAPVGPGMVGTTIVSSRYISAGYWQNDEQTAARFSREPDGSVRYRQGDLGRIDESGQLVLLGRGDAAVKIRGYLVEPSEIESALLALGEIQEAVVVVDPHGDGHDRLVAFVVPRRDTMPASAAAVRTALRRTLPEYMVPAEVVTLAALPRTERGKIDRRALPAVPARVQQSGELSGDETAMGSIWCDVLGLPFVNADDDFLACGGDSLTVEELLAVVEDRYGVVMRSVDLMKHPTLADFTRRVVRTSEVAPGQPDVVRLNERVGAPAVFWFAGGGALGLQLAPLAAHFPDLDVHAFQAHGMERRALPDRTVRAHALRHLQVIRLVQPHGPYRLLGHSFGGLVALETAQLLRAAGEVVDLVALVDTYLPGSHESLERAPGESMTVPARPRRRPQPRSRLLRRVLPEGLPAVQDLMRHVRARLAGAVVFAGTSQFDAFFDFAHLVARRYDLQPYPGRVLMVHADHNPDGREAWTPFLTGDVVYAHVGSLHSAILREPHVSELAQLLRRALAS